MLPAKGATPIAFKILFYCIKKISFVGTFPRKIYLPKIKIGKTLIKIFISCFSIFNVVGLG